MNDDNEKQLNPQGDDKPYKYAVSTTFKTAEDFRKLADTVGLSQGELFLSMIEMFKATNATTGANKVKEIQDLNRHLKRVEEIFVSLVNELGDCKEDANLTIQKLVQEHTEKSKLDAEEIKKLHEEYNILHKMFKDETKTVEEQERTIEDLKRTMGLIEKSNFRLENENEVLREQIKNFESLEQKNKELLNKVAEQQRYSEELERQVGLLKTNIETSTLAHKEELKHLTNKHQSEIESKNLLFEKEKFELQKSMAASYDELKKSKDAEIDKLKNQIHIMETEKNTLVEELLRIKNSPNQDNNKK